MSPRRIKPRTPPRAVTVQVPGQLGFDCDEPWQPTSGCTCWPPVPRGCGHCKTCDSCQDCGRCAGRGCVCECEDDS
ncbi:hypothetical protein [Streptomyces rhizosphaericus]|uniref:Uncharacterized protein n=1 Tax=Streptomyces rhizosphaericus TaxID=114699 RepID=A0A6G4AWN6_9ACTN|nr:hypothetical protein [Streptomyces rhizosphaericus]NEW77660.1 hypothetical protein [Streptomyces rhizosphaericus]